MTQDQFDGLTPEQRAALRAVFNRRPRLVTWTTFMRSAFNDTVIRCVMVPWSGMTLGIEEDGHTHS